MHDLNDTYLQCRLGHSWSDFHVRSDVGGGKLISKACHRCGTVCTIRTTYYGRINGRARYEHPDDYKMSVRPARQELIRELVDRGTEK